ncbi:ATP-binding cassette domain-containing protein, partial [Streptomyces sp. NPDC047939]|uniref:ABC transporter ATP-binding protein n=1 Tax=Streptomyces sp. NPDC047939 TaxID=3155381 RepID=UPI00343589B2
MRLRGGTGRQTGDRPEVQDAGGPDTSGPAVELRGVRRRYGRGAGAVHALAGIDLVLPRGTFTAVMGPSGSGKSTFLQCAAGLDRPSAGSVHLGGTEITGMGETRLTELRRSRVGFVFQAFNLLPSLTVEQNVLLPMRLAGQRQDRHRAEAVRGEVRGERSVEVVTEPRLELRLDQLRPP